MAGSTQFLIGTSAAPIASAPKSPSPGPIGWFYLINGSQAIYLGGPNVTSANGAQVAANSTLSGWLFSGDSLYAVTASSTSTVGVLATGQ